MIEKINGPILYLGAQMAALIDILLENGAIEAKDFAMKALKYQATMDQVAAAQEDEMRQKDPEGYALLKRLLGD